MLYVLRDYLCGGNLDTLKKSIAVNDYIVTGIADMNLTIVVPFAGVEAYFYRSIPSTGDQWQQCYNETDSIIKQCINNGPNTGWVNGPNVYPFYQGGFRPKTATSSYISPISTPVASSPPTPVSTASPTVTSVSSGKSPSLQPSKTLSQTSTASSSSPFPSTIFSISKSSLQVSTASSASSISSAPSQVSEVSSQTNFPKDTSRLPSTITPIPVTGLTAGSTVTGKSTDPSGSNGVPSITAPPTTVLASASQAYASAGTIIAQMNVAAATFSSSMSVWNADQGSADLASAAQQAFTNLGELLLLLTGHICLKDEW